MLPPDNHVHSQWSWDALDGAMDRTCARAVELGLPAVAFTEHVDFTEWTTSPDDLEPELRSRVNEDGLRIPPDLDVDGYLACLQGCRERYPDLRILSGVELGEPHWHGDRVAKLIASGSFDRVLGSLHGLPSGRRFFEPTSLYRTAPVADVVRDYLAEVIRLVEGSGVFAVLAHIDFPIRYLPGGAPLFDPYAFEEEFRAVLRALAGSGRALEVNTQVPLASEVVRWWYEEGGEAVSFGSDAHEPTRLAFGFSDAAAMVESCGFGPGRHPYDFWRRTA